MRIENIDYRFEIRRNATNNTNKLIIAPVSQLIEIFKTLPMALSPSYLYHRFPAGFKKSVQPGFLTSQGALLFGRNAADEIHLKPVNGATEFGDAAWEGQLFVPVWEPHQRRFLVFVSILLGWLYLDLPQYITPTPGISPTMLFMGLMDKIWKTQVAEETLDTDTSGIITQWIFFSFHVIKVAIVWLIVYCGAINPISFNPLKNRRESKLDLTQEKLISIGWTGSRRVTPLEWREENRKHQIESIGGIAAAYNAGILEDLGKAGVYLGKGEGWETPLGNTNDENTDSKFLLSPNYFSTLFKEIAVDLHSKDLTDDKKNQLLKSFRRSGPIDGPTALQDIYKARKNFGHGNFVVKKRENLLTE